MEIKLIKSNKNGNKTRALSRVAGERDNVMGEGELAAQNGMWTDT